MNFLGSPLPTKLKHTQQFTTISSNFLAPKMVAQLDSVLSLEENPDHQFHGQEDDPFEAEETLSLCDLPTHSDSANSDDFSKEYQNSSFDQDQDDFFEFFSEGFTASTYPFGDEDIIFCGKLIPYNKEAPHVAAAVKKTQKDTETSNISSTKKWGFFRWSRFRRSKSKVVLNWSKPSQVKGARSTTNNISFPTAKSYKRCDLSLGKVSKSKWYLFMTGMARFPTREMELRDIKSRQNRRSPSTMFGDNCKASNELMGKGNKEISSSNGNSRAKGLWGLLRASYRVW